VITGTTVFFLLDFENLDLREKKTLAGRRRTTCAYVHVMRARDRASCAYVGTCGILAD
jgi:hypothetical protein